MKYDNINPYKLFIILVFPLFLSFNYNFFHAVNPDKFYLYQNDSESLVIGRLVKSEKDGIYSSQARMGRFYNLDGEDDRNQTKLYLGKLQGGEYEEYNSQIGLQAIILGYVDKLFSTLGVKKTSRLDIYHAIASFLFASVIALIILLLYKDIGFAAGLVLFVSILLAKWPVYSAKNLYWAISVFFVPILIVYIFLKLEESRKHFQLLLASFLVFLSVLIKSTMGYEYISSVLLALLAPIVYFSVKNNWSRSKLVKRSIVLGVAGLCGFLLAIVIHINQLEPSLGSYNKALEAIKERVMARTQTDPLDYKNTPFYESQTSSVFYVLYVQLIKGGSFRIKIPFLFWIIFFAYISYQLAWKRDYYIEGSKPNIVKALIVTTWFSLLAPLSWFILAKSHTYIHKDINLIVWHMPFMIFGFSLAGLYWKTRIQKYFVKISL